MKKLAAFLFVLLSLHARAATYTSPSVELSDVQATVNLTVNGDIVMVPAGTASWTNQLLITNLITLLGAGTNYTIIYEENATASASGELIRANIGSYTNVGWLRISGFTFRAGTINTVSGFNGSLYVSSSWRDTNNVKWRIDHCRFENLKNRHIYFGARSGLIDHNYFSFSGQTGLVNDGRRALGGGYGDDTWSKPVPTGTENEGVYIEDNVFTASTSVSAIDAFAGTSYVFRYNISTNCDAGGHGTESTQQARSVRYHAAYGNTWYYSTSGEYANLFRGGSGNVFSNQVNGASSQGIVRMVYYRLGDSFTPWGGAFGNNNWDLNSTVLDSGSLTAANGTSRTLTDSSKNWTVNQWVGHSIYSTSTATHGGFIASSTSNTVTVAVTWNGSVDSWTNGEPYEIGTVIKGIDQPGAGSGDLTSYSNTPAWPNQTDEPIYIWANSGKTNISNAGYYCIVSGRDYTNSPNPNYTVFTYPHPLIAETEGGNTAPTISGMTNITIPHDTSATNSFTIGDAETAVGSLTVTVVTSDESLTPTNAIVLVGQTANRQVKITPASGLSGSATITVTVSDGTNSTSSAFLLTVTGDTENTAPTIDAISDQVASHDDQIAVPITIADAETAKGSLLVSASASNNNLVASVTTDIAKDYLIISLNAGYSGKSLITATVTDTGGLTASCQFMLTVRPDAAPAPARWIRRFR